MDTYEYHCPVCGFVYWVPEYWASFDPEPEMTFAHIDLAKGTPCECEVLKLKTE